jgi:hypothetical protein
MVGLDENDYSDIALQWMLEELVDDGDEIICLRVVEKDSKIVSDRNLERRQYQKEARALMERIQTMNDDNRAIGIVLEFAVGKLHATFQKMVRTILPSTRLPKPAIAKYSADLFMFQIQIYEPAMLIVGTRGRSLGGFQGLVSNRNSFSKWCLQYSPVPVVVVRPTEKRMKKKKKRSADPNRQDYIRILRESGIDQHETDAGTKNTIFEEANHPDVEANAVAAAVGLQAGFDPALDAFNIDHDQALPNMDWSRIGMGSAGRLSPEYRSSSPRLLVKRRKSTQPESSGGSGEESSERYDDDDDEEEDEDDEEEFEAVPGHALLSNGEVSEVHKRQKLHEMEVAEAAALAARKLSIGSADSAGSPPSANDEDEELGSTERPG